MKYLIGALLGAGLSWHQAAAQQIVPPLKREFLDSTWHVLPSAAGARYRRETEYRDSIAGEVRDYYLSGQLQSREKFEDIAHRLFDGKSEYFYANGQLKLRRYFRHGKRTGDLYRYYETGQLMRHEEFADDKRVRDGKCFKEDGTPEPFYIYASLPKYSEGDGSQQAVVEALVQRFNYPQDAQKAGIQGRLLLSFKVTEQGQVENIRVLTGLSPSIDKEAIRAVSLLANFSPALDEGRPIGVAYTVPFILKLR